MNLLGSIKDFIGNIMTDGVKVSEDIAKRRLQICKKCPHLFKTNCTRCGCFVKIKTEYADQECPIKKW